MKKVFLKAWRITYKMLSSNPGITIAGMIDNVSKEYH